MKIVTKRVLYECFDVFWEKCLNLRRLRHRIISMPAPGMAAQYPFDSQVAAFDRAVFRNGFYTILTAGRGVATGAGGVGRNN